jgi:hypothetical protein
VSGPSFGWIVDDWEFVLHSVRCRCGWFLAKAEPIPVNHEMGFGIGSVEGECKRHGHVTAESWDIIDAAELR